MSTTLESAGVREAPIVSGYTPVSASLIKAMGSCRCDIFKSVSWSPKPALFCAANYPITTEQVNELSNSANIYLYVRQVDHLQLQSDLRDSLDTITQREDIPLADRYGFVQAVVNTEMTRTLSLIHIEDSVDEFHKLGGSISQMAVAGNKVPAELLAIAQHSAETFKHMINVATYCALIAESLGISNKEELKAIATGGLLHDIGKRFMPKKLLNKVTSFDIEEKRLLHKHPQKGYEELCHMENVSFEQLMMVYQHHERIDGKGYPVRITGKEMHLWSRICAIADVFEGMTGKRAFRKPEPIAKAVENLMEGAGTHFDKEIVKCWSSAILKNS